MKVSAGPSLLLSAIVLLGFPQLPKARCEWDDWLFWRPASLFTTSKKDRQPSPVKGAGSQVTSSARSTVPFRVATTTATTVSPTEKTRKARAGTADWWRSLFSLERFRSISRRVVPNENDKELTRTSSPPSSGPSSTATTTASPKRDEDGKLPYSGKSEEMGEWMNAKSPKEIGEGTDAESPEKIGEGTDAESPEKIGEGTDAESPEKVGEETSAASSTKPVVEKNEVLIWKEPDDPVTYPRRDLPPLRGLGLIMAGIVLATFSSLTVVPVVLGAFGTGRYVGSIIERDSARRNNEDEERRYNARREIVRAKRRRLWLQTFYSSQARKAAAEKAKRKRRRKEKKQTSEGGREESEKVERLAERSNELTSPEERVNFSAAEDTANEEGETAEDKENTNS